jgi:tetratricopeptide (TPR) repeat protein
MEPPRFEWRDAAAGVHEWRIQIRFVSGAAPVEAVSQGEPVPLGEIDPRCVSATNKPPELYGERAHAHTWKPTEAEWNQLRKNAIEQPATVQLRGYSATGQLLSQGSVSLSISRDPVGAPIFYRDVPLMPSSGEKGVIKPLDQNAVPLIAWRMRNLAEPESHVVMTGLHSCANCHSFSADGKTLGLDMDGPQNDKGLYAVVPVAKQMTVRSEDMVSWSKFSSESNPGMRVGFMSQLSPNGRYVMTTIKPPGSKGWQFYYVANFTDYRFLQVFYPARGILATYDRETEKLTPLPGASDPNFVQATAVWAPDGKSLIFARARAQEPNPTGAKLAEYANDPAELKVQYDLYRIPFNDGRGGTPEPIAGASNNGMSNSFPKFSPDGKWIVFVQAKNGLLMRPDSKLWIVPASGGQPRLMNCNTSLMNSWHSFSPNGRWLVFSSKSLSPYTQMFLTHIDENGVDSPAIRIENSTAANRAVNIPEFVNMDPSGIDHIATPAVDFYARFDHASELSNKGDYAAAEAEWKKVLALEPDDVRSHFVLGEVLLRLNRMDEGIAQLREATRLNPQFAEAHNNLGVALGQAGHAEDSLAELRRAIEINPDYPAARNNLGLALLSGGHAAEAEQEFRAALASEPADPQSRLNLGNALIARNQSADALAEFQQAVAAAPTNAVAHNGLGLALANTGQTAEAAQEFARAVELAPDSAEAQANLGRALLEQKDYAAALPHLNEAARLNPASAQNHASLGLALAKSHQMAEAIPEFERALSLDPASTDSRYYLGKALILSGRAAEGVAQWRQALTQTPEHLQLLNDLAWVLSTSSDPALRNGPEAVRLAEHAVALTQSAEPALLGTLAAAQAESGQLDLAVATEQKAIDLAAQQGNEALAESLRQRLALFQSGSPIRQ